jgi:O-antigen/teichoic acid export membrane protein
VSSASHAPITATADIPVAAAMSESRAQPPVLGRLLSGTLWLALRVPLQALFSLWSTRLVLQAIGPQDNGAYSFAWGFGFFQFLLEFGASSALQRQISDAWTRGDREGVDRSIACGMTFYAAMAMVQAAALLGVAYLALPHSGLEPESYPLVIRLLWLQALTAPCFGFSIVITSVLQAARRYDFVPRFEILITIMRFAVLVVGLGLGYDFFRVVVAQTLVQIALGVGPALWVMVRELGYTPHFRGARWEDYKVLGHFSLYVALIQISVVLADKLDTTILGFMLDRGAAEQAESVYSVVSKPFVQLRQTGWMLAYMVMPAVASLAAARDERGLERVKYDGTRLHVGVLLPIGLLAWIHAGPFLSLWIGDRLHYDAGREAPLMRLFLAATVPLVLSVPVQMAIGLNKIKVIALAALIGSLVNLPMSCYLTARLGVSGVIWGTVLTTFFSNLLVPGIYVFRELKIDVPTYLRRTMGAPLAGGLALLAVAWALRATMPVPEPAAGAAARTTTLIVHLVAGCAAYVAGYLLVPAGRADLGEFAGRLRRR